MYSFYKFETRGIGIISTKDISENTYIGEYLSKNEHLSPHSRLIYDGWIETNPLGRYLNHNSKPNLYFVKRDSVIQLYTKEFIHSNVELTVDYTEVKKIIGLPDSLCLVFEIFDFDYVEEKVVINKNII